MTSTIDLHDFLRSRRSIRRFKPDPVPDSVLQALLATATFAPSAHNRQPWRFFILKSTSAKSRLAEAMASDFARDLKADGLPDDEIDRQVARSKSRMTSAPIIVLINLDMSEMDHYPDEKRQTAEYLMAIQSVANAGMQMLLAAHAEGLGGVWVCSPLFAQETIRTVLALPDQWEPQALLFIGYPEKIPAARERKSVQEITVIETT